MCYLKKQPCKAKVERNQKVEGAKGKTHLIKPNRQVKTIQTRKRKKIQKWKIVKYLRERKILTWQKEQKRRIVQLRSAFQRREPPWRSTICSDQFLRLLEIFVPTAYPPLLLLFQNFLIFLFLYHTVTFCRECQNLVCRHGEARSHSRDLVRVEFFN